MTKKETPHSAKVWSRDESGNHDKFGTSHTQPLSLSLSLPLDILKPNIIKIKNKNNQNE